MVKVAFAKLYDSEFWSRRVPQPHSSTRQLLQSQIPPGRYGAHGYPMMTLDDWMKKSGLSESQVGEKLGVSPAAVNRYRQLKRIPKPDIMDKIEKMTGGKVTGAAWLGLRRQQRKARGKQARLRERGWLIDRQKFASDILKKRARDAMTFRELEEALGLDKAVLHRAESGGRLSDDNFAVLLNWLGQPASVYLKMYRR
jgi:transcriptional regulator with XRE-family HTH domain